MPESNEIRRLTAKWKGQAGWPKRLDWIEIKGLRGWTGQRFSLDYPIMAVVGENGVGKSTVLQCAASVYQSETGGGKFASQFFPDTAWEQISGASIEYTVRENGAPYTSNVRRPTDRWRGNPERRKRRVQYIDLSRIQPVATRVGYARLAKIAYQEVSATAFDTNNLNRLCNIMGRNYQLAKMSLTSADTKRLVPVITRESTTYSGFHQGAGETTVVELLQSPLTKYSLVLIDEIESSLHPRAQRRLIRELAVLARELELQIILTTHSPYVLEELPMEARAQIIQYGDDRQIIYGVSPEFAMSKMDDIPHPECDVYVEDVRAQIWVTEIIAEHASSFLNRCQFIPYGASSTGRALGQMVSRQCFPRKSVVFLDGDCGPSDGCAVLPGGDAPEQVVFGGLMLLNWCGVPTRIGRLHADFVDLVVREMQHTDHHRWISAIASQLAISGDALWQAMCAEWARNCMTQTDKESVIGSLLDLLGTEATKTSSDPNESGQLF